MNQIIEEKKIENDSLTIEYFETPNPNTMKFYATGFLISPGILIEFDKKMKNVNSNLAKMNAFQVVRTSTFCKHLQAS